MREVTSWLEEYAECHRNRYNKLLHWICVPLILLSLIGLLWSLPVPQTFQNYGPSLNWGTLMILAALVYYYVLSPRLAVGMTIVVGAVIYLTWEASRLTTPLWELALVVFILAWIGQFIGHHIEGKKPAFFKDLQFLLIGPLWVLAFLYRLLRIPY